MDVHKFAKAMSEILSRRFNCEVTIRLVKKPEVIERERKQCQI